MNCIRHHVTFLDVKEQQQQARRWQCARRILFFPLFKCTFPLSFSICTSQTPRKKNVTFGKDIFFHHCLFHRVPKMIFSDLFFFFFPPLLFFPDSNRVFLSCIFCARPFSPTKVILKSFPLLSLSLFFGSFSFRSFA